MSRSGRLNVLVVLPLIFMLSLLSAISSVSMSLALALFRTWRRFARLIPISCGWSISYSVNVEDSSL